MSEDRLTNLKITDISLLDGREWEIVTGWGIIGVSYHSLQDSSRIVFTDEKGNLCKWKFNNNATITFRGSNLLYDPKSKQN